MCSKIFLWVVAVLAILMGVVSLLGINNPNYMTTLMVVSRFFEVMIPVLGVGALVKYVFCCAKKCGCGKANCNCGQGKCG
jgi:cytochrome c oxidase assembly factor CtaG